MHPLLVLVHLASSIMLLLWSVRMVRTGFERAYGGSMKRALRAAHGGYFGAAIAGAIMAVLLQSSTAVGILASGFAASGLLAIPLGIAAFLGADLGSALVTRILLIDLSFVMPFLLIIGVGMFMRFEGRRVRQTGRILIGIALILLSLRLIGEATEPIRETTLVAEIVAHLRGDPLTAAGVAALFAWLVHSGVASILLLSTFTAGGVIELDTALPMVLGANVGAGLVALWLSRSMGPVARRIPVGNAVFRSGAALAALFGLMWLDVPTSLLGNQPAAQVVNFHVAFNALLVIVCLPFCSMMARAMTALLPEPEIIPTEVEPAQPRVSLLDRNVIDKPKLALASATRELLRMGETVEMMFHPVMELLETGEPGRIAQVRKLDEAVNLAHREIKLYIAEVNRGVLSEEQARLGIELTDFAINLEHAGDIISKTLLPLALEKNAKTMVFSEEGLAEMRSLHGRVETNISLALNVLVSRDIDSARQIVREKEIVREVERRSHDQHLTRLQQGVARSIETSNIHLEVLRAFKEINSLVASTAYPILTESGQLLQSRLA